MKDSFYKIDNIFTEEQRHNFIKDVQRFLIDGREVNAYYGSDSVYQEGFDWFRITHSTLQLVPEFKELHQHLVDVIKKECGLNFEIKKSWVNLTKGRKINLCWHNHKGGPDYAAVYYMKIFPFFSNGTLFKDYGLVKAKQNSLMIFDPTLEHTTPSSPLPLERYTWALDLYLT